MRGRRGHEVMILPIMVQVFSLNSSAKLRDVLVFYFLSFPWLEVVLLTLAAVRDHACVLALRLCSGGLTSGGLPLERHDSSEWWAGILQPSVYLCSLAHPCSRCYLSGREPWQGWSTFANSRPARLGSQAGHFKIAFQWLVYFFTAD